LVGAKRVPARPAVKVTPDMERDFDW
jgi:hypothetical protein